MELTAKHLETAIELAIKAHSGQTTWNGGPYILHPLAVMGHVSSLVAKIVAVLHDVVEDSDITVLELRYVFGDEVGDAVELLTHRSGCAYQDYIALMLPNALAREVKEADLQENLNAFERDIPADKRLKWAKLAVKYLAALETLRTEKNHG